MDFINNDGSYAHRGVWHVTDNLKHEHHDAKVVERKGWRPDTIVIDTYEETDTYEGDAICGQRDGIKQGGYHWSIAQKGTTESAYRYLHRKKRADVVLGLDGYIPGPLCSRCAKKAGIEF